MSGSPEQSMSQNSVEPDTNTSPNINTPPLTPAHKSATISAHLPLALKPCTFFLTATPLIMATPIESEILSHPPSKNPIEPSHSTTEDQGNTSALGHTCSSLSGKHFEEVIAEEKGTDSNILAKGPEWVAKNLLELRDQYQSIRDELTSPDLTLALGKAVYDVTPASEI